MQREEFLREALSLPTTAIEYYVSERVAEMFPGAGVVQGGDSLFDVEEYAEAGLCTLRYKARVHNQVVTHWRGREMEMKFGELGRSLILGAKTSTQEQVETADSLLERGGNVWFEVQWRGATFDVIVMHWPDSRGMRVYRYWIIAEQKETAREFLVEVCRWNAEIRGEVLVFDGGCWRKDRLLFQSIKGSTFENLILKGSLKEDIARDLRQFFENKSMYEQYGIPWKRGILFVGPPGNGKTHTVKAIINAMQQPCLYVKSFRAEHRTDEDNIKAVFERARKTAPCILVLEDLDTLLTPQNRSFFLNELDGFAANVGIVTLATTNHPERLDPSILDRPSRFDRKYPFLLPELTERREYIVLWNGKLKPELQLTEEGVAKVAELTEGFSFAYLKELFLSSMMSWVSGDGKEAMEQVMERQVGTLREQMVSALAQPEEPRAEPMGMRPRVFMSSQFR